jgi:hypothetical protein
MPKSEFDPARLIDGTLHVSGTVVFEDGEPRPDGDMRIAWVCRQGWRFAGGIALVSENLRWAEQESTPGLWAAAAEDDRLGFAVEAFGTLLVESAGRIAEPGGPPVIHDDAFVWTQVVPVYVER